MTELKTIEFEEKRCPYCKKEMSARKLGVWGYYCDDCMMWWGTHNNYPEAKVK